MTEFVGGCVFLSYNDNSAPQADDDRRSESGAGNQPGNTTGSDEARQLRLDAAVDGALQQLVRSRLPSDRDIQVFLCGDPKEAGVPLEKIVFAEQAAYGGAGYGHRAEGLDLFAQVFRGYESGEHGPLRYIIVAENTGSGEGPKVLVSGNYFEVHDGFSLLGPEYAAAVTQLKAAQPGLMPDEIVGSKLVTDPTQRRVSAGLLGLGGLVLAAMLRGLASTNESGIVVAARTQPASQAVIRQVLPRLVPMQLLLDAAVSGGGEGGLQAMMLAHVPFPSPGGG